MTNSVSMSVDAFKIRLRREIEGVCDEHGLLYDKEADRGYAFELWIAKFLIQESDLDLEPTQCTFRSRDLKIDIAFDDDEMKSLNLVQTKHLAFQNFVSEDEVVTFFDRHNVLMHQSEWVREHASDELHELIADYAERVNSNWNINFYFICTCKISHQVRGIVEQKQLSIRKSYPNINFILLDFLGLKEEYIRWNSVEASISEAVEIQFARENYIQKSEPHYTILAVVKGTALAALYKKERERLFAYNIRNFLGKRVNKTIIDTAVNDPEKFYYFNNGVSAICTHIRNLGDNKFRFENFQIINGAQTVSSLAAIGALNQKCEVVLRITEGVSVKTEKGFNADIILYNNTQNVVRASDFRSNDQIQIWLEEKFSQTKARGAVSQPLKYVRKRSHRRVRGAVPIKFEELAKIRYSYFYEPTQCVSDPRSLWTRKEDGGFYERSFGLKDDENAPWSDDDFLETLFAVIAFLAIVERIKKYIKEDKAKFYFLQRLRFWALALVPLHLEKENIDYQQLLESKAGFDDWFKSFWALIIRDLALAYQQARDANISNFALARNESRWIATRNLVDLFLSANLVEKRSQ